MPKPTKAPIQKSPVVTSQPKFLRGDINGDGQIDISDFSVLPDYLYLGGVIPPCLDSADTNDDGKLDLTDWVVWLDWFNGRSKDLSAPGTKTRGIDPTADAFGCAQYPVTLPAPTTPAPTASFKRGDINSDGKIDITDMFALSQFLNEGQPLSCYKTADVNDDGKIDISDLVYWSGWFVRGGEEPKAPGTKIAGADPTPDQLTCKVYPRTSPIVFIKPTPTPKPTISPTPASTPTPTQIPIQQPPVTTPSLKFLRGDINSDGRIDITDIFTISQYINEGESISCEDSADVNDDGKIDVSDLVYWSNWWNRGGPEPKTPGTKAIGIDPTADTLTCVKYPNQ